MRERGVVVTPSFSSLILPWPPAFICLGRVREREGLLPHCSLFSINEKNVLKKKGPASLSPSLFIILSDKFYDRLKGPCLDISLYIYNNLAHLCKSFNEDETSSCVCVCVYVPFFIIIQF